MSDNRYYVKRLKSRVFLPFVALSLLLNGRFSSEYSLQVGSKPFQRSYPLRRGFDYFLFVNEDFATIPLHERAKALSHTPTDIAQNLQTVGSGDKKCQTAIAQDTHGLGKALKGLQVKTGEIEALELFFRKHSKRAVST
jgi:hypothetical protein